MIALHWYTLVVICVAAVVGGFAILLRMSMSFSPFR